MSYLDKDGLTYFWSKIKAYFTSIVPSKTSDLTNDSGFITRTDYASYTEGGTFKPYSAYGFGVNANGYLFIGSRTQAQYDTANDALAICKATLENVKDKKVKEGLQNSSGVTWSATEKTTAKNTLGITEPFVGLAEVNADQQWQVYSMRSTFAEMKAQANANKPVVLYIGVLNNWEYTDYIMLTLVDYDMTNEKLYFSGEYNGKICKTVRSSNGNYSKLDVFEYVKPIVAGETITVTDNKNAVVGNITTGGLDLFFTLPIARPIAANTITGSNLQVCIRGVNGYVGGSGMHTLTSLFPTVSITKNDFGGLVVRATATSAPSGSVNNTPVVLQVTGTITFS